MGIDAESRLLDNKMNDKDTEALSEPFEVNYKDYNMLPICVEQADEVALTLDKLIKRGKIPKNGIFYKYLKAVLQVSNVAWNWKRGVVHPRNNEPKLGRAFRQNFEET